jgi:hypothetical protein
MRDEASTKVSGACGAGSAGSFRLLHDANVASGVGQSRPIAEQHPEVPGPRRLAN